MPAFFIFLTRILPAFRAKVYLHNTRILAKSDPRQIVATLRVCLGLDSCQQAAIYHLGSDLDTITPTQKKPMFRSGKGGLAQGKK